MGSYFDRFLVIPKARGDCFDVDRPLLSSVACMVFVRRMVDELAAHPPSMGKKSHRDCPREEDYQWFRLGWTARCVSSTGEPMSVGRLVGFDPNTPRSRRVFKDCSCNARAPSLSASPSLSLCLFLFLFVPSSRAPSPILPLARYLAPLTRTRRTSIFASSATRSGISQVRPRTSWGAENLHAHAFIG